MSIVTLHFGQCGNQIGQTLYQIINEDIQTHRPNHPNYHTSAVNKWFNVTKTGNWEPRSVLVDTESKAVDSCMNLLPFKFRHVVAKPYGGSANNWAFGYNTRSKLLGHEVLDCVRTEVEKCDFVTSFLNVFSSSGGTGSGVGTAIIEQLREEYPTKTIVNSVVLPYGTGEIVTQSYNSLLALARLYPLGDACVLFENDRLHYICNRYLGMTNVGFSDINWVISEQLAGVLQPLNNTNPVSVINNLTSHPSYKFLQILSEPNFNKDNIKFETTLEWRALIQALSKQNRYENQSNLSPPPKKRTVSNSLIIRGNPVCPEGDLKSFMDPKLYVPWLSLEQCFTLHHQSRQFHKLDKYLALVTNSNSVVVPLNTVISDAWTLFTHGAYLHHYKNCGVDEDWFLNAFQTMEDVLHQYKTL